MQTLMIPSDIFRLSNYFGTVPAVGQVSVKTCSQLRSAKHWKCWLPGRPGRNFGPWNMAASADTIIRIFLAWTIFQSLLLLFLVGLEYLSKSLSSSLFNLLKSKPLSLPDLSLLLWKNPLKCMSEFTIIFVRILYLKYWDQRCNLRTHFHVSWGIEMVPCYVCYSKFFSNVEKKL